MTVPAASPYPHGHGRVEYAFCSQACSERVAENPEAFSKGLITITLGGPDKAKSSPIPGHRGPVAYTCPMHPEIQQNGPGICPKCGMALETIDRAPVEVRSQWICPMHPE